MSFKISKKDERRVRCEARSLTDKGNYKKTYFYATFEVPSQEERKVLATAADNKELDMSAPLREYLTGWDQVLDGDGEPLEFNDENLELVLDNIEAFDALRRAFGELIFNREDLRGKN